MEILVKRTSLKKYETVGFGTAHGGADWRPGLYWEALEGMPADREIQVLDAAREALDKTEVKD